MLLCYYIPEIWNFGNIMVLVRTPSPLPQPPQLPHAKACVSRINCDSNARIKFIFDTAIDDLEWKNPIYNLINNAEVEETYL